MYRQRNYLKDEKGLSFENPKCILIIGFMSTRSIYPSRRLYEPEAGDLSALSVVSPCLIFEEGSGFMGLLYSNFLDFWPFRLDQAFGTVLVFMLLPGAGPHL